MTTAHTMLAPGKANGAWVAISAASGREMKETFRAMLLLIPISRTSPVACRT